MRRVYLDKSETICRVRGFPASRRRGQNEFRVIVNNVLPRALFRGGVIEHKFLRTAFVALDQILLLDEVFELLGFIEYDLLSGWQELVTEPCGAAVFENRRLADLGAKGGDHVLVSIVAVHDDLRVGIGRAFELYASVGLFELGHEIQAGLNDIFHAGERDPALDQEYGKV